MAQGGDLRGTDLPGGQAFLCRTGEPSPARSVVQAGEAQVGDRGRSQQEAPALQVRARGDEPPPAPGHSAPAPGHSQMLAGTQGTRHLLVHAQPRPDLLLQQLLGLHPGGDELLPGAGGHHLLGQSAVGQAQRKLADLWRTGPCSHP